jgi:hypothetical protein
MAGLIGGRDERTANLDLKIFRILKLRYPVRAAAEPPEKRLLG